jgi:hypothetical protein
MAFSQSNLNSGIFTTLLVGSDGIAEDSSTNIGKLYYTTNSGATWILSKSGPNEIFWIGLSESGTLGSLNGVAASRNIDTGFPLIYYTTNSGQTWTLSETQLPGISNTNVSSYFVNVSGLNAVISVVTAENNIYLFCSIDGGKNWTQTINKSDSFNPFLLINASSLSSFITLDGSITRYIFTVIPTDVNINYNIYTSDDGGRTISNVKSILNFSTSLTGLTISGSVAILAGRDAIFNNGILYRSIDGGFNWDIVFKNTTRTPFRSVSLDGGIGMAAALDFFNVSCLIFYSSNNGETWTQTTLDTTNVLEISQINSSTKFGVIGISKEDGSSLVYYTNNGGSIWTFSADLGSTFIIDVNVVNSNSILGTTNGIYYTTSPLCYEKNTLILIKENDVEVYKKVCELKVGDLVKTYKQGYKKIKYLKSFTYRAINNNKRKHSLYKMKGHDIILTAKHGILVDELSKNEIENIKRLRTKVKYIEDKKVSLAYSNDDFEKLNDDKEYELFHFVLENDNINKNYGVYITDGILSESCSEAAFLRML